MKTLAATLLILLSSPLLAQEPGPVLKLSTANGQTTFHIGERIPIVFSFTGPDDGSYTVSLIAVDRLSGIPFDDFTVSPSQGWADPLAQYLAYTGGAFSLANAKKPLSATPVTRSADLNEWVRFDSPGTYTVTDTSHRVAITGKARSIVDSEGRAVLKSNELQLHIVPATPEWQKNALTSSLRTLAAPDESYTPSPERDSAMATIRYLATPEAIAALASDVREDTSDLARDATDGLVGLSPANREVALAAMNRLIDDPRFPIAPYFLDTMAWLRLGNLPLPDGGHADEKQLRALQEAFETKKQPLLDAAWQAAASALARKVEPARAVTAQTLLDTLPENPPSNAPAEIGATLRKSFPTLSKETQTILLYTQWDIIGSRELLPELRELAQLGAAADAAARGWGEANSAAIALRRWYEFEPNAALHEILKQIGTPEPTLSARELAFLPTTQLPQFEPLWLKSFSEAESMQADRIGSLLIRFGTGSATLRMAALSTLPTKDFGCNRQVDALAYVVHFDPAAAKPILEHAADHPKDLTLCYGAPLYSVSRLAPDPVLTEAALRAISSPYPNVVEDALMVLDHFGDDKALQPILERYLQWSEKWTGKPEPPSDLPPADDEESRTRWQEANDARRDYQLGDELARALLASQAWIADPDLIATVRKHCVGKSMCDEADRLSQPNFDVSAYSGPEDGTEYEVGQCRITSLERFEAKLDQFPKGTAFMLVHATTSYPGEQRQLEATLPALLEKHGMKLRSPTP